MLICDQELHDIVQKLARRGTYTLFLAYIYHWVWIWWLQWCCFDGPWLTTPTRTGRSTQAIISRAHSTPADQCMFLSFSQGPAWKTKQTSETHPRRRNQGNHRPERRSDPTQVRGGPAPILQVQWIVDARVAESCKPQFSFHAGYVSKHRCWWRIRSPLSRSVRGWGDSRNTRARIRRRFWLSRRSGSSWMVLFFSFPFASLVMDAHLSSSSPREP